SKVIRADYGADEELTDLAIRAIEVWEEWNRRDRRAGRPELYHPDGFLLLSRDELRPGGFEGDSHDVLRRRGFALERVGPQDTALRFPAWNPGLYADGYLNPRAGWAESGRVV